jgi:redox-sensing transcriptional repressor
LNKALLLPATNFDLYPFQLNLRESCVYMPKRDNVSIAVIRRLPRYYRFLGLLLDSGFSRISSKELSQRMGLTASQIRQDLNCFGGFGQQGYGYNVEQLHDKIGYILGLDKKFSCIIIGAGNIGRAIANNMDFNNLGYNLNAIFDINPSIVGQQIANVPVLHLEQLRSYCEQHKPRAAVLTIPSSVAPEIVDLLMEQGVNGYWNFTHYDLTRKYPNVVVENVHLGDSLMTLCYRIKNESI